MVLIVDCFGGCAACYAVEHVVLRSMWLVVVVVVVEDGGGSSATPVRYASMMPVSSTILVKAILVVLGIWCGPHVCEMCEVDARLVARWGELKVGSDYHRPPA